jgi:hypothetical protein
MVRASGPHRARTAARAAGSERVAPEVPLGMGVDPVVEPVRGGKVREPQDTAMAPGTSATRSS